MKLVAREEMIPGKNLKEKFTNLEKYGFEGIEFWGEGIVEREKEIIKVSSQSSVKVSTICARYEGCLLSDKKEEREKAIKDIETLLKVAGNIGAVGLIVVPIKGPPRLPDLSPWMEIKELEKKMLIEILVIIGKTAEDVGSICLLEPLNRYETHLINRLKEGVEICNEVGSFGVKIMADFFHMNIEERKIDEAIKEADSFIYHIHLADSTRLLPGYGHIDFKSGFAALNEIGYDKYMGLECGVPGKPEKDLPKCVKYLRECGA